MVCKGVFLGFDGLKWVCIGFGSTLTGFTEFFTGFDCVSMSFTGLHWVLLGLNGFHWVIIGCNGFTEFY